MLTPKYDDGNYGLGVINGLTNSNIYYNNYYNRMGMHYNADRYRLILESIIKRLVLDGNISSN